MDKKGQEGTAIIGVLVAIILGVVLLGVIYTMVIDRTTTFSTNQDLINYSTAPNNLLLTEPTDFQEITGTPVIINTTNGADLTATCNLTTISENPYLRCSVNHTTTLQGLANISYNYLKQDYYTGTTTRTIGGIIPVMLAVGILVLIAFVLIKK